MASWKSSKKTGAASGSLLDVVFGAEEPPVTGRPSASLLDVLSQSPQPSTETSSKPSPDPARTPQVPAATDRLDHLDRLERALEAARARRDEVPAVAEPVPATAKPAVVPSSLPTPEPAPEKGATDDLYGAATLDRPTVAASRAAPTIDLASVTRRLLRFWFVLAMAGLIGGAIAYGIARTIPNEYQALARLLIEPRGLRVLDNSVAPQGLNSEGTIAYVQSQVDIISSSSVLDSVIEEEGLLTDPEFVGEDGLATRMLKRFGFGDLVAPRAEDPRGNVTRGVYERLYVGRQNQTFVIEIGMSSRDPVKSARLTNAVAQAYLRAEAGAQSDAARNANSDLTARLDQLGAAVAASEQAVNEHKAEFGLVETNGRLVDEDRLARLTERLSAAAARTAEALSQVELARTLDVNDVVGGGVPSDLASPAIPQLRLEYARVRNRLDRLAVKLGNRHPERLAAAAELSSARAAIAEEISRLVDTSEREFDRAKSNEAALRENVEELRAANLGTNSAKSQLRELERRLDADRRVYEAFLQRSRETGEETNIKRASARIISAATPPLEKVGPNRKLIALIGAIAGATLAALLLLVPTVVGFIHEFLYGSEPRDARAKSTSSHVADRAKVQAEPPVSKRPVADPRAVVAAEAVSAKRTRRRRKRSRKPAQDAQTDTQPASESDTRADELATLRSEMEHERKELETRLSAMLARREASMPESTSAQDDRFHQAEQKAAEALRRSAALEAELEKMRERDNDGQAVADVEAVSRPAPATTPAAPHAAPHPVYVQAPPLASPMLQAPYMPHGMPTYAPAPGAYWPHPGYPAWPQPAPAGAPAPAPTPTAWPPYPHLNPDGTPRQS